MKASQILYEAAEYAFVNACGACSAIDNAYYQLRRKPQHKQLSERAEARDWSRAKKYLRHLAPYSNTTAGLYWWQQPDWQTPHEPRVLGLLFAAAIAKSEGN